MCLMLFFDKTHFVNQVSGITQTFSSTNKMPHTVPGVIFADTISFISLDKKLQKKWDEITYPFPGFNRGSLGMDKLFLPHFTDI